MDEKQIEKALVARLRDANSKSLRGFVISGSTSDAKNLGELIGDRRFEIFEDNNAFNPYPKFMIDIFGGLIPDIVLRSSESSQNRIYIEVKLRGRLNYGVVDSQIVRYFLQLLSSTAKIPEGASDIRRATLLAAPSEWFRDKKNWDTWQYFLDKYTDIAQHFDVTLGKLEIDNLLEALSSQQS